MAKINTWLIASMVLIIRLYRYFISGLLGARCRFDPSCSQYAIGALQSYGCIKGCCLMIKRILRCHPGCEGGIDPVP